MVDVCGMWSYLGTRSAEGWLDATDALVSYNGAPLKRKQLCGVSRLLQVRPRVYSLRLASRSYSGACLHVCEKSPSLLQHVLQYRLGALLTGRGECHAEAVCILLRHREKTIARLTTKQVSREAG